MTAKTITLSVYRYDPDGDEEPRLQSYDVPYRDDMVVLDALNWVKAREYLAAKYCGAKVSINRVHEAGRFDCWATRR